MNTNSNDFSRNLREALQKYESRFSMPENLISDTIAQIDKRRERRSYIRGLVAVWVGALVMIACGVGALLYLPLNSIFFEPELPAMPHVPVGSTIMEAADEVGGLLADPIVGMTVVITAILLILDYMIRRIIMKRS